MRWSSRITFLGWSKTSSRGTPPKNWYTLRAVLGNSLLLRMRLLTLRIIESMLRDVALFVDSINRRYGVDVGPPGGLAGAQLLVLLESDTPEVFESSDEMIGSAGSTSLGQALLRAADAKATRDPADPDLVRVLDRRLGLVHRVLMYVPEAPAGDV
jgi:hypothetical protein